MPEHFNRIYKDSLIQRLEKLSPDTQPKWGQLNAADLIPHLASVMKYSMGRLKPAFIGNWFTRTILKPFIMSGMVPIPKNVRIPLSGADEETVHDIEPLSELLDEYLSSVEKGTLDTNPHPLFGEIGVDGWTRFHVKHFEHHLKQFGL